MNLKTSKTAKLIAGVSGVAIAFSLAIGAAVAPASAATVDDLMAQITALTAQLNALKGTSGSTMTTGSFNTDLSMGMTNADVKMLQMVLNKSADTMVASSGAGSPGMESTYFGAKTKAAVIKFQAKNKISPASGYVGPKTRALLNSMGGVSTGTGSTGTGTTVTTGTGLSVMSAVQPSANLAPASAARIPFTKVTLTASNDGDVTVNGVVVERSGLAQDAVFAGIVLLDENGMQLGIAKTLNSNHQVTVGDPFVIKAGQSKTVTVAGNMASSLANYAGQVAVLNVVGVNSSATVNGSFPISGAANTINATLSLGTAQLAVSSFDPSTSQTKEIGTTGYKFAGVRLTAGSAEKIRLWSIRFNQSGSASSNDLANIQVFVDGTAYPTTVSSDGKYYTASFGSGLVLDKGLAKDIYIQGDIVGSGAAGRTVKFDIYKTTDIYISGETYTYGITPTASNTGSASDSTSEFTTSTPFFDGSKVTVSAGSVTTISKANSVAAQNIAVNVPNQVLGGYQADIKGEAITVQSTTFTVSTSTASLGGLLTNVSLYDQNGAVVAGPVDATASTTGTLQTITFTDTITYPIGLHVYTLKGKVPSSSANNGSVVTVQTNPGSWTNITGQTTGNTISLSSLSAFSMNPVTVKGATLAIAVGSSPAAQTVVAGAQKLTFATYSLNATQSGEDVRFSTIPLRLTLGSAGTANNLSSCQLWDGTTALNTGSNVVNPTSSVASGDSVTFTLDQSLSVTKGTSKTLTLTCNLSSNALAGQSYAWGITNGASIAVTGVTSSNDVSESITQSNGSTMTVGSSGTLTVSGINTSTYKIVAANTTGNELARFNLRAENEQVNVEKVGLTLTSGSSADLVNGQVTLWDGSTQIGVIDFTGVTTASSTLTTSLSVAKGTDKVIVVKGDLSRIGTGEAGTPGRLIKIDYSSLEGKGANSGTTVYGTGSTSFAGSRVQKSYPVITVAAAATTPAEGNTNLVKVTVAANASGDIVMNKLTFGVASSTFVADRFEFIGPTGNVSSSTAIIMSSASTTGTVYFDSTTNTDDRYIQANTSKDFYFKGININLTGGTNSDQGTITVTLKGDTAYPTLAGSYLMASSTVSGLSAQKTLWSPISTTSPNTMRDITAGPAYDDWTNGYGIQATCSGSPMVLGQDCTGVTLTK